MRPELERLLRKSYDYTNKYGSDEQKSDIIGIIAQTVRYASELDDLLNGVKDIRQHSHHPVENLKQSVIDGRRAIGQICREVVISNKSK